MLFKVEQPTDRLIYRCAYRQPYPLRSAKRQTPLGNISCGSSSCFAHRLPPPFFALCSVLTQPRCPFFFHTTMVTSLTSMRLSYFSLVLYTFGFGQYIGLERRTSALTYISILRAARGGRDRPDVLSARICRAHHADDILHLLAAGEHELRSPAACRSGASARGKGQSDRELLPLDGRHAGASRAQHSL
jgi:hypothetical protein